MMRLVWPDRDTMPDKKRKGRHPDDDPAGDMPQDDVPAVDVPQGDAPDVDQAQDVPAGDEPQALADESPDRGPGGPVPHGPADVCTAPAGEMADGAVAPAGPGAGDADDEDQAEPGSAADIDQAVLEALLFSTHHPLTPQRLGELLDVRSNKAIKAAVQRLNESYEQSARSFRVEQVAGGYQLLTLPEYGDHLKRLHQKEVDAKLTRAAIETLAIIAYKQPILRADVEAIRGVACGETIRSLMEKHLVKIAGRAEEPGRPILYGTTKRFLELFGLNTLKDLPQSEDALPPPKGGAVPSAPSAQNPLAAQRAPETPDAPAPPAEPPPTDPAAE